MDIKRCFGLIASYKENPLLISHLVFAPQLVLESKKKQRTVAQALHEDRWIKDIYGGLTVQVILDYLLVYVGLDEKCAAGG